MKEIKGVFNGCIQCDDYTEDWENGCQCYCGDKKISQIYTYCPFKRQSIIKRMLAKFANYVIDKIYNEDISVNEYDKTIYFSLFYPNKNSRLFFEFPESSKQKIDKYGIAKWLFWIRHEYVRQWNVGMEGDSYEGEVMVMILPFIWLKFGYSF